MICNIIHRHRNILIEGINITDSLTARKDKKMKVTIEQYLLELLINRQDKCAKSVGMFWIFIFKPFLSL